jgi:hypothetical protein
MFLAAEEEGRPPEINLGDLSVQVSIFMIFKIFSPKKISKNGFFGSKQSQILATIDHNIGF